MEQLHQRRTVVALSLGALALSLAAGGVAALATRAAPDLAPLLLAGLLAAGPAVAFGLARYNLLVALAFAAMAVVRWEPAPVDLLIAFLLGLGLVTGRMSPAGLRGSTLIHASLWVFAGLNLVALLNSADTSYSVRYVAISFYLIALAYFIRLYITSAERMRLVLLGYLAGALGSVALIGLELAGISGTQEFFVFERRALALFKDANVFSPFLVLPIVFLVDELLRPHLLRWPAWVKAGAILALAAGVFLAFSRAAWANLALALTIYLALSARSLTPRQWGVLVGAGVAGALALAALVVQLGLLEFLLWRATPLQSYDSDRFGTQADGLGAGLSHLFGIGPGMLFNAHSLYVRTFAEYGFLGPATLFVALLAPLPWCLRRARSADDRVHGLSARVAVASFVGLLFNSVVIDTIHWRHFWILFALCWVVAAATAGKGGR